MKWSSGPFFPIVALELLTGMPVNTAFYERMIFNVDG